MADEQKRRELIQKLLEMQRKFIEYEHEHGLDPKDYYVPDEAHPLHNYRQEYMKTAMELVDVAHERVGSHR